MQDEPEPIEDVPEWVWLPVATWLDARPSEAKRMLAEMRSRTISPAPHPVENRDDERRHH
jgi:hypothetical protein